MNLHRFILGSACVALLGASGLACGAEVRAVMQTSEGTIELSLDSARAPITVKNFIAYVNQGFYNGTIFHRVIDGFMIQGGGFDAKMNQKRAMAPIVNEARATASNKRGTIAMARTPSPHSASSQFFINLVNNDFLDAAKSSDGWGYAVFGRVTRGMDVVDKIARVKTGSKGFHNDVPLTPVVIESVTIK